MSLVWLSFSLVSTAQGDVPFSDVTDYPSPSHWSSKPHNPRHYAQNFASNTNINAPGMVRLVYFLPNDRQERPERKSALQRLIKEAQQFYAAEMDRHGYGRKTFTIETDNNGAPVVHQINGKFRQDYYYSEELTDYSVWVELLEHFDGDDLQHVYFIAIDLSYEGLCGGTCGGLGGVIFYPTYGDYGFGPPGKAKLRHRDITPGEELLGGFALIPAHGRNFEYLGVTLHELGHGFGLVHDFRAGLQIDDAAGLSECAAEWLSVSRFFNPASTFHNEPGAVELLSLASYSDDVLNIRFKVTDPDGLHQAQLLVPEGLAGWGPFQVFDCKRLNGTTRIVDTVVRSAEIVDRIALQIMDLNGNITWATFSVEPEALLPQRNSLDVNGDGVVNLLDLIPIASHYGKSGKDRADVDVNGVVDIVDVLLVAGRISSLPGQTVEMFVSADVQKWLTDARAVDVENELMANGRVVLEYLLAEIAQPPIVIADGARQKATLQGHTDHVWNVAFSPDGQTLASSSWDHTIRLWDPHTAQHQIRLIGHTSYVFSVSFSPDGQTLASAGWDKTIRLWNPHTGQIKGTLTAHPGSVASVAFSPDGGILASGGDSQTLLLWDTTTWTVETTLTGHTGLVEFVAFSPDGATLASGSRDSTIRLWNPHTTNHIRTLTSSDTVNRLAFSPDSQTLASAGWDNTIRLWNPNTGKLKRTFPNQTGWVNSVAFSPDGATLAIGNRGISLWDIETGQYKKPLAQDIGSAVSVVFSPDGTMLASGSADTKVRLWDLAASHLPPPTPVNIPDKNLRAAINKALGKASGDTITPVDMTRLTELHARHANISDLTGLAGATNLTKLDLDENNISDISPVVGLTNLTWVLLGGNNISDISALSGLTSLTGLSLYNNSISDISALSRLTNLTALWLGGNTISDISPLVANTGLGSGDEIDVRGNPLSVESVYTHIPVLQQRGVTIQFDDLGCIVNRSPNDFVGRVYTPVPIDWKVRSEAKPLSGVVVTILSGAHRGKSVVTDQNGQYTFTNVSDDELHLLVEKEGFEPKGVIVHRERKTLLANGDVPNYREDPQQCPGNILIGQRWADEVRPILEQVLVVHDLLFVDGGTPPANEDIGGFYSRGVAVVYSEQYIQWQDRVGLLGIFAHEIAHAHQHATVSVDGSAWGIHGWVDTPEGRAFAEARQKDWEEVGKARYDSIRGYDTLVENAAETLAHYWSVDRWGGRTAYGKLEIEAPNRFKWAQQWVNVKPPPPLEPAPLEPVNIPDANLRAAINKALGKASGDSITIADMARLTHLEARNANISDLTGLESATNLTRLNLGEAAGRSVNSNSVSDLSPLLELTNLTHLWLERNAITDLSPLAGLTHLTGLNLGGNHLSNISALAGLTNLRQLWLWDNNISDLSPVAGLTHLRELILQSNAITDISSLVGLTNLTGLWLAHNNISDLSPLVANTGVGSGDRVFVNGNSLNFVSIHTHIPALQSREVVVEFDDVNVGEPRTVRMIYFLPNDRPYRVEAVQQMKADVGKSQMFFAEQMRAHGYGDKTFRVETDSHGEPIVHRVAGQYPDNHYLTNPPYHDVESKVLPEITSTFNTRANIYLIFIDTDIRAGGAGQRYGSGGHALFVTSPFDESRWKGIAHELGHAFGLGHDFRDGSFLMSYGPGSGDRLAVCHADFLDAHPYFNFDTRINDLSAPTIKLLSPRTYRSGAKSIPIRLQVSDKAGLAHAILYTAPYNGPTTLTNDMSVTACFGLAGKTETVIEFDYDGIVPFVHNPPYSHSNSVVQPMRVDVVDTSGNMTQLDVLLFSDSLAPLSKVSGDNLEGVPNTPLPVPFVVELWDVNSGFPRREVWVTFTVTAGGGRLSVERVKTDDKGRAESTLTLGPNFGTNTVLVSAEGVSVTFNAEASASVDIPDPNLRAAIEKTLGKTSGDTITIADMARLTRLDAPNANIVDLTGLETATNLTYLNLDYEEVEGRRVNSNAVSDLSPLAGLTKLTELWLQYNNISDLTPLSGLTNLRRLEVGANHISDISALTGLTNLRGLWIWHNNISDLSPLVANIGLGGGDSVNVSGNPLSYPSVYTHIPVLQQRGVEVEFDARVPQTVLKISGDDQQALYGETLPNPFVVEVQDGSGDAFEGVPVMFAVTEGGGTLRVTSTTTDANGRAESTLTLGNNVGINTVSVAVAAIQEAVPFTAVAEGLEFNLSVPMDISLIHVPLKVATVGGVATAIESIGDLYGALGGAGVVNFLITYDSEAGVWLSYFGPTDTGSASDRVIADDTGIVASMTTAVSVQLTGTPLGTDGNSTISLTTGLNLIGIPLRDERIARVSDLLALDGIFGNAPVIILTDGDGFKVVGRAGDPGDVPLTGGQGFILNAQEAAQVTISGEGWINTSKAAAPVALSGIAVTDTTPVLGLRGAVVDERTGLKEEGFGVRVKNLSTRKAITGLTEAEGYQLTVVDIENGHAAMVGDTLEVSAQSPNPLIGVQPLRYTVTAEDVRQGLIQLPKLIAYEIPAETELLSNYPNPFNPETWIPFRLAEDGDVTLTIYDLNGQVVRTLDVGHRIAAVYQTRSKAIYFDGRNQFGEAVASGVYFYHLSAGNYSATRKMLIIK